MKIYIAGSNSPQQAEKSQTETQTPNTNTQHKHQTQAHKRKTCDKDTHLEKPLHVHVVPCPGPRVNVMSRQRFLELFHVHPFDNFVPGHSAQRQNAGNMTECVTMASTCTAVGCEPEIVMWRFFIGFFRAFGMICTCKDNNNNGNAIICQLRSSFWDIIWDKSAVEV